MRQNTAEWGRLFEGKEAAPRLRLEDQFALEPLIGARGALLRAALPARTNLGGALSVARFRNVEVEVPAR